MDRVIEKLPTSIRNAIRPDPVKILPHSVPLTKDALDYRPAAAARIYDYDRNISDKLTPSGLVRSKVIIDMFPVAFTPGLAEFGIRMATNTPVTHGFGETTFAICTSLFLMAKANYDAFKHSKHNDPYIQNFNRMESETEVVYYPNRVRRYVYSGDQPLQLPNTQLQKGDNFLYLKLRDIDKTDLKPPLPPEVIMKWMERMNMDVGYLKDANSRVETSFKAVAIELPDMALLLGQTGSVQSRKDVFSGKKTPISDQDRKVLVVSAAEFENLDVSSAEVIKEAAKELGDPLMNKLLELEDWSVYSQSRLRKMISDRANQVLRREIEANFNGPERINNRDENWNPVRQKTHPLSRLAQTAGGYSFIQTIGLTGEVRSTPLQKLLKIDEDLPGAIKNPGKYKKAQMAFIIQQMIRAYDMDIYIANSKSHADGTRYYLERHEGDVVPMLVDTAKERKGQWKFQALQHGRKLLSTALIYAALRLGANTGLQAMEDFQKNHPEVAPREERAVYNNSLPPQGLEWKLIGEKTDGYWVVATSHEFKDGGWKDNIKVVKSYDLPVSIEDNPDHIHAENVIALSQFGNTRIRIPRKPDTQAVALSVTDTRGDQIKSYINEFEDGNIELVVPFSLTSGRAWGKIKVTYAPTEKPTIHATQKIPSIKTEKLNEAARKQIEFMDFVTHYNDNDPNYAVASSIAGQKTYSLNPPGGERVNAALTPEDYLNAQAELEFAICETANTLLALENAAVPDAPAINPAVGYIAYDGNTAGHGGGYLRTEAWHRFNLNDYGTIVDATPFNIASDELTQAYIRMLHGDPNQQVTEGAVTEEVVWSNKQTGVQNFAEKQKDLSDFEKELGLGVGALVLGAATYKSAKILRSWRKSRDGNMVSQETSTPTQPEVSYTIPEYKPSLFAGYQETDIARAVNFFGWLSFGRHDNPANLAIPLRSVVTPQEAFDQLKRNVNPYKVAQYLEDPKAYEKHYGLSESEAEQLRKVAAFLVG